MAVSIQSAVRFLLIHATFSRLRSIGLLLRVKICLVVIGGSSVNKTVGICVRNGSCSTSIRKLILMMVTICRIRFLSTSRCLFTKGISIRTGIDVIEEKLKQIPDLLACSPVRKPVHLRLRLA
jgi:hypothetical protein